MSEKGFLKSINRRTLVACALVLVAGVALLTGGVLAYLTDTDITVNTFSIGEVMIDTIEPKYPGNGSDEVRDLVPMQEVPKDPQIKNSGKNRAVVFMQVDIPMVKVIHADEQGNRFGMENIELFDYRTEEHDYDSVGDGWELLGTKFINGDGEEVAEDTCAYTRRLYGYNLQLEENEISTTIFDVIRLSNVIENQIDNSTHSIIVTGYGIQADNIADITTAHYDDVMTTDVLRNIYNVYVAQSGDIIPEDADTSNNSTLINTTLNVTMTVENMHLKLQTGDPADAKTAANVKIAYTGKGEAPGYTFESSNPEVATIDDAGNIQAVSVGNTVITVRATNPDTGREASASVTITVRDMNAGETD